MNARFLPAVLSLAALPLSATPAHAGAVCFETNRVAFWPPLTTFPQSGTFDFSYTKQCVRDNGTVYSAAAEGLRFFYAGSCVTATISAPSGATVVGGLLLAEPRAFNAKYGVLVPDSADPCNFSTGFFYGIKLD